MPKKLLPPIATPTLVQERLTSWGRCILNERLRQRIKVADLCARVGVSEATLRRLERGDPGAAVGTYLTALLVLGVFDDAVPALPQSLMLASGQRRVKSTRQEREHDADYF
ncbi:hypothetical protein IP91_03741 [Pseudoduganella lurida]|uniref:Helix-turn-helix domain-containing protein n=1 Tax=Pseudoduganella lurida TaxID=1036180 RepID=A0A562R237_9BURK|nr:helix-turn-helix transcriptional regulator [Pseudoduganella lurida]TWI62903.1 hypothetical protein IP91_03741 [Pseudoduganella lurida]